MARLECAAAGIPTPQISWRKDGGADFPAAKERRMHVLPQDDVFFITNVQASDAGQYACIAKNPAGTTMVNTTLVVRRKFFFIFNISRKAAKTFIRVPGPKKSKMSEDSVNKK